MIPNCSDRTSVFRNFHSRCLLFPRSTDRFSVFRNIYDRRFLFSHSSNRTSVFRNFHSRYLLLASCPNRICVLRNGYYWSRFIPFACKDFFFNWRSFVLRKDSYNRTSSCCTLDSISFYRIASFTICSLRNI